MSRFPARQWLIAPCDMPDLRFELYERLMQEANEVGACYRSENHLEPLVSVLREGAWTELQNWTRRPPFPAMHRALAEIGVRQVPIPEQESFRLRNLNRPPEAQQMCAPERKSDHG